MAACSKHTGTVDCIPLVEQVPAVLTEHHTIKKNCSVCVSLKIVQQFRVKKSLFFYNSTFHISWNPFQAADFVVLQLFNSWGALV